MIVHPLYSSSSGNSTLIYNERGQILIDAGTSFKKINEAATVEVKPEAVFISHVHSDHIVGAGPVCRKTFAPVYMSKETYEKKTDMFNKCSVKFMRGGDVIETNGFTVEPFSTRHDVDSLGFVITDRVNNKKLGYLTDTGSITKLMKVALIGCDAYYLEADYDEQLLKDYDDYDQYLKDRIMSPWGHLSNKQVLGLIEEVIDLFKTEWIVFGHLSVRTNDPDLVLRMATETFPEHADLFECAPLDSPKTL